MTIFDFMHAHIFATWLLAWGVIPCGAWLAAIALQGARYALNRILRSINIALRGWPPAHLDADGDFRPLPALGASKP